MGRTGHPRCGQARAQQPGHQRVSRSLSRSTGRVPVPASGQAGRRQPAPPEDQPVAGPGHQERRDAGDSGRCAENGRLPRRRIPRALRGPQGSPGRRRHSLRDQPEAGSRAGLLQQDRFRMGHRQTRRPGHRVCRWSLRRPGRANGRQADRRRWLCHGHRTPGAVARNPGADPARDLPSGRRLPLRLR
ncbi:hypothetical protein D3C84_727250 [compost metagenome]